MDCRDFDSLEEMNEYMIEQWNHKVQKNDEVVILGDFSWGDLEDTNEVLNRLNGRLFLIRGNHDRFLEDKNFDPSRFGWIENYRELKDNRRKVILSHYPIACYNGQYRRDEQGNPKTYMLHGHIHNTQDQKFLDAYEAYLKTQSHINLSDGSEEEIPFQMLNCFCQFSDYVPLSLDEWIELHEKRKKGTLDTYHRKTQ